MGKCYSQISDFGVVQLAIYMTQDFTAIVGIKFKALKISRWGFIIT